MNSSKLNLSLMSLSAVILSIAISIAASFDISVQNNYKLNYIDYSSAPSGDKHISMPFISGNFFEALGMRESNNNYKIINSFGYVGKYQFGEEVLIDTGYYIKNGAAKNDWKGEWTGKDGIRSLDSLLNSPRVQNKIVKQLALMNWSAAKKNGLHLYLNREVNGVHITKSGILAGMHLVGVKGVVDFIKYGKNSKDGFGTGVKDYLKKFKNYHVA